MYQWLKSLSGLSLLLLLFPSGWTGGVKGVLSTALTVVLLSACTPSDILKGVTGTKGTSVVANVPIGKEVTQTVGVNTSRNHSVTLRPKSRVDSLDQSTTGTKVESKEIRNLYVQTNVPYWFIALFLFMFILWSYLLWKLPSPEDIWDKRNK